MSVLLGTPIKLSRNVVVAPVYSVYTIRVNLWDSNGQIAGDCLRFPAYCFGSPSYIRTQDACVKVQVGWDDAYKYRYGDSRKLESSIKKPRVSLT
mgnify:CR=1 FL=1